MRDYLDSGIVDFKSILVEEIPKLPNITALTVTISTWSGHSYAASLASLIAQCVNLEELHIDVKRDPAEVSSSSNPRKKSVRHACSLPNSALKYCLSPNLL
jgi:hypothetical protein